MLFSPFTLKGLQLKNRITMAPLYLGYANPDGTASPLLLAHYREMAASGAAMIVVENAAVDAEGLGSPITLRVDDERYLPGLTRLAQTIREQGAVPFLQINHAGRYAFMPERLAPSPVQTGDVVPRAMTREDMEAVAADFVKAARLVKEAGFDGVELHGGTGYLLTQFLSPRTNLRDDEYGGPLANRMRFPLEVTDAVMEAVGREYPVGYRFLADEWQPDGLHPDETLAFAEELEKRGIAYLSVMAGTYDAFFGPEYQEAEKHEGFMVHFAEAVKKAVPRTPVITAGRIQRPETAEAILKEGKADLIGLARVLLADPLWPQKAQWLVDEPIVLCEPTCSLCIKRAVKGKPVYCAQWSRERRGAFLEAVGEKEESEDQSGS
jgi:2,4-dienoyl-CoA reductase (NADPH2)